MNFKGHAIGAGVGAVAAAGVLMLSGFSEKAALIAGGVFWIGGQLPDFDVASIPARWFGRIGFLAAAILFGLATSLKNIDFMAGSALIGLAALLSMAMKHRGPFHSFWTPIGLCAFAWLGKFESAPAPIFIYCFAAGILVHLTLDGIFPCSLKGWIFL